MKINYFLGALLVIACFIWIAGNRSVSSAQAPTGSRLRVVSSDSRSMVIELTVADFKAETVEHDGQLYQRLLISDTVQSDTSGAPQLPMRGVLLGVPSAEGVSVQLLEADTETLSGYQIFPAPQVKITGETPFERAVEESFGPDQALYATNAFYPDKPVSLGYAGMMRDQAVAQIQIFPAQYNPVSGQIQLYRRLRLRLSWDSAPAALSASVQGTSPAYEQMLQSTLLNYSSLPRPAAGQASAPLAAPSEIGPAATEPSLKISVSEDGFYQLSQADLIAAGLDLSGEDPRTLKISNRGQEIPIVVPGEADGTFDSGDLLRFYGQAITDQYTTENIYWLTVGGLNGQRMSQHDGTPGGAALPAHFLNTIHAEENTEYWLNMVNGDDHFFWGSRFTAPLTRSYSLTVTNISTATTVSAAVRVGLHGRTSGDHHTKIIVNGVEIDDRSWSGQIPFTHTAQLSQSLLNEGLNTIQVSGVGDTGSTDQFHLNWLELDYWDSYVAENDLLRFEAPATGPTQFEITNFTTGTIDAFNLTHPAGVVQITGTAVAGSSGSYSLTFQDNAQAQNRYLALSQAQYKTPPKVTAEQPSTWKSTANGVDYIIITHSDFYTNIVPLANYRASKGLRVATVRVEDIYDEFNDGIFNPQAIRDFLAYALSSWTAPAPTYVLLVGDAFYDYKNQLPEHVGTKNYIPTQMIKTDLLSEVPSDNWYVSLVGADIIPDMFIGRLGAQTSSQVDNMVNKIIQYEQSPPPASWNSKMLLVADDDSTSFDFTSDTLAAMLPAHFTANKVYARNYPPGDPTTDITSQINAGNLFINYTGHGNLDRWGSWSGGRIFWNPDIISLGNSGKWPIVTVANCLNGYFAWQETGDITSLAEQFLRLQDTGGVASWAATGLGYPSAHRALMVEFYDGLINGGQSTMGGATTAAKVAIAGQNSAWDELITTFVLIGDPAMQVTISSPLSTTTTYVPVILKEQ